MTTATAYISIVAISVFNALLVFGASLLGVYGDGSAGALPVVLGGGLLWVGAFAAVALHRAWKGEGQEGVSLSAKALPYGLLLVLLGSFGWLFLKRFLLGG